MDFPNYWLEYRAFLRNSDPTPEQKQAYEFEHLWPCTLASLHQSAQEVFDREYEPETWESQLYFDTSQPTGLISTVGLSPEPIAGTIEILKPAFVCFIHTAQSVSIVDRVMEWTHLAPTRMRLFQVEKDDPVDLYEKIRDALNELFQHEIPVERVALDPTGGTKLMPFIGGVLCQNYNLSLIYVSNTEFDPEIRRPIAGTEYFRYQPRLALTFPDGMLNLGLKLIDHRQYGAALQVFRQYGTQFNPIHHSLVDITQAFTYWDEYNYTQAETSFQQAGRDLQDLNSPTRSIPARIVNDSLTFLEARNTQYLYDVIDLLGRAKRQNERNQPIEAIITSYMAMELLADNLARELDFVREQPLESQLSGMQANPTKLKEILFPLLGLSQSFEEIQDAWQAHNPQKSAEMPPEFGLVASFLLFAVFDAGLQKSHLGRLQQLSKLRNDIVHRLQHVSQETVQGSFETCEMMINYYWKKLYPPEKHDILQDLLVNNPINQEWMSKLVEWARRAILISFRR